MTNYTDNDRQWSFLDWVNKRFGLRVIIWVGLLPLGIMMIFGSFDQVYPRHISWSKYVADAPWSPPVARRDNMYTLGTTPRTYISLKELREKHGASAAGTAVFWDRTITGKGAFYQYWFTDERGTIWATDGRTPGPSGGRRFCNPQTLALECNVLYNPSDHAAKYMLIVFCAILWGFACFFMSWMSPPLPE